MELRIPVNKRRAAIVKEVIRVSGGGARRFAGNLAIFPLSALDEIPQGESELVADFAMDSGCNYETILRTLRRFEEAGWIRDIWRKELLDEARDRLDDGDCDAEWLGRVIAAYE